MAVKGGCASQICLWHGPIITKVNCVEVTHSTAQLWRNMNVWLTARPVLLLNGLLLRIRLLFSLPLKTADSICYRARSCEKILKNKRVPHILMRLMYAWIPFDLMSIKCGSRLHNNKWELIGVRLNNEAAWRNARNSCPVQMHPVLTVYFGRL